MMTKEQVFEIITSQGIQTTLEELETELATFTRPALIEQHRSRITIEVWDGCSPINGIPAERVRQSEKLPEGAKGYWVYVDNKPTYLQLTSPFAGERVITDPASVAERHVQAMAEEFADQEILQTIIVRLRERADTRMQAMEDAILALMLGGAN